MPLRDRVEKTLYIIAVSVFAVVVTGTVLAFALGKAKPGAMLRRAEPVPADARDSAAPQMSSPPKNSAGKEYAYTALGQIRAAVKPENANDAAQVVLVSPWFLYPPADKPFYEELSAKNRKLKIIVRNYFSERTLKELLQKGEAGIKSDIISLINEELTLGKIPELYFDEYIFFD